MRIAFLVHWRGGRRTGPFRKIAAQVLAWRALGHEVAIFAATSADAIADWTSLPVAVQACSATGLWGKLVERRALADLVLDWSPDVVYERHGLYYPGHRQLARRARVVTEVNGDDMGEWPLKSRGKAIYNRFTRDRGLADVAGLVFVTHELSESRSFSAYAERRPTLVLANGIDLRQVPWTAAPPRRAHPLLVFVGHRQTPWHGVDHLMGLAQSRPDWYFDVVGLQQTEVGAPASENVTFHGELRPPEYAHLLATADVAVGSLALYREGLHEACSLKVREYLAAGLPVILGCRDTDFPTGADFLLRVPNEASGLLTALPEVDRFVERWRGRRVPRTDVAHLDVTVKEARRLEFLEQLAHRA